MSAAQPKRPVTLKSLLALAGAGLLYLLSQVLGLDLTGKQAQPAPGTTAEQGAPSAPAGPPVTPPTTKTAGPPRSPSTQQPAPEKPTVKAPQVETKRRDDSQLIQQLFRTNVSDRIVEAEGRIVHILPLDEVGDRHQNFLVELTSGVTLKISHNIDLAPQLPIKKGDTLRFHGEYEWNEKGGVVHWTHRDPANRHEHGWLELAGKKYE